MNIKIKRESRINIIQNLLRKRISWCGVLDEVEFLERIWNLEEKDSNDHRFDNIKGEIVQHRQSNSDWTDYWIFDDDRFDLKGCDDELFLKFLCETIHDTVRRSSMERKNLLELYNQEIRPAGFEIVESKDKFGNIECQARNILHSAADPLKNAQDYDYLAEENIYRKILLIQEKLDSDTALAIGTSKELVETICKTILKKLDPKVKPETKFHNLVRQTLKILDMESIDLSDNNLNTAMKGITTSLTSLAQGIAESRNKVGTGHGQDNEFIPIDPKYARLVVYSAGVLVIFLLDMFKEHPEYE